MLDGPEFRLGEAGEKAVERWLRQVLGKGVIATSHASRTGGAALIIGELTKQRALDLQASGGGVTEWVEVKTKDHCDSYRKGKVLALSTVGPSIQWQHGIDLPPWKDYLRVQHETGLRAILAIVQNRPAENAPECPVLLWQYLNELLKYRQLAPPDRKFIHGKVLFPINSFRCSPITFVWPPGVPRLTRVHHPWTKIAKDGKIPMWDMTDALANSTKHSLFERDPLAAQLAINLRDVKL